jgi:hypothetical protein
MALTLPELNQQIALLKYRVESRLSASLRRSAFKRLVWLEEQRARPWSKLDNISEQSEKMRTFRAQAGSSRSRWTWGAPAIERHLFGIGRYVLHSI